VVDLLGTAQAQADGAAGYKHCERGLLVPAQDAPAFARALARLCADESLRAELGQAGEEYVQRHYSRDRLLTDIRDLYRNLVPRASDCLMSTPTATEPGRFPATPQVTHLERQVF
jgi:hypothetical protein